MNQDKADELFMVFIAAIIFVVGIIIGYVIFEIGRAHV